MIGHKTYFDRWWKRDTKNIAIHNYKKLWKENGIKPRFGIRTNHACKRDGDTCFDLFVYIGYIVINYTNFAWGK
jgi:sulfatase maturation enzyme AslB (radical SAM superfamily)